MRSNNNKSDPFFPNENGVKEIRKIRKLTLEPIHLFVIESRSRKIQNFKRHGTKRKIDNEKLNSNYMTTQKFKAPNLR